MLLRRKGTSKESARERQRMEVDLMNQMKSAKAIAQFTKQCPCCGVVRCMHSAWCILPQRVIIQGWHQRDFTAQCPHWHCSRSLFE